MRWTCSGCGEEHEGLRTSWAFEAPAHWPGGPRDDKVAGNFLGADTCVIEAEDFFVRACLNIPIHGIADGFLWGVWISLSRENFMRTYELWDDPRCVEEPPYFGWFSNRLPGYPDTLNLKTNIRTRSLTQRPVVELEPTDHPLAIDSRNGITLERAIALAELMMHGRSG
jgi:hypothetical protein